MFVYSKLSVQVLQKKHYLLVVLCLSDEIHFCDGKMSKDLVHVRATSE